MQCFRPRGKKPACENEKTAVVEERQQLSQSQPVGRDENEVQQAFKYQLSRLMHSDDSNIAGNVHGGVILKMIEEAGCIVSTRHCNVQNELLQDRCLAALVRVEKTEFLAPVFIGEIVRVTAEITFTSKHSLEVQVKVLGENILTGAKKLASKAALWYVPCSLKNIEKVMEVPPIKYASAEQEEEGRKRYEAQKLERMETKARVDAAVEPPPNPEQHTVGFSQFNLIHLVGPSDCTLNDYVHGGLTMKLMDDVAGIVAARHCSTNVVTMSVEAINFHRKIKKACVLTVTGRITFISNKSMEIEAMVDVATMVEGNLMKYRAVTAFFTYISLDKDNKPLPIPALKIETEDEQRRFDEGKARYLQQKAKRLTIKEGKQ